MESTKRRLSCPQTVQLIWDAICIIRHGKQQSSIERILAILKKKHGMEDEDSSRQLKLAVLDNLLYTTQKIGSKGSQVGVEQTIYHLPEKPQALPNKDGHDWYCFRCQKGGSVLACRACFRVYHAVCCNREDLIKSVPTEKFMCPICVVLKSPSTLKLRKDDLNTLLGYTCLRLKEKPFRDLNREPPKKEDLWRETSLIYNHVDLAMLEERTRERKYRRLEEFEADVQNMVHNVVIYYGVNSPVADMARQMLRDCSYDLREIKQCQDCYRMSNEKKDRYWFCQPCDPPHELVFAKQKGYPFWPAKVIRRMHSGSMFDVRFFGGPHERATVEKANIRPITTCPTTLGIKRSTSWTRACDEMKKHQEILAKRMKISPMSPDLNSDSIADEGAESEDEPRPKKIDRYFRTLSVKSSPKEDMPEHYEDWTPIRRSERSKNKTVHYKTQSDSAKKEASKSEEKPAKTPRDCAFEENGSDEDKDSGPKPRRKSEPSKMLGSQAAEERISRVHDVEFRNKTATYGKKVEAPLGVPEMPEVRKRGRPPGSVPKVLRLPAKMECCSEGSEDSNPQMNSSRRTNPKRAVTCKTEAPEEIKKESRSLDHPLALLGLNDSGMFEIKRPNSRNGRCGQMESKSTSKIPGPITYEDKHSLSSDVQLPRGVRINCKVKVKRLVSDAGPSETSDPDEPKPKRRVPFARSAMTDEKPRPGFHSRDTPRSASAVRCDGKASLPDLPVSSSTPTPDDLNVVSSSSQLDTVISQVSMGTQTSILMQPSKVTSKYVQTDPEPTSDSAAITRAVAQATRELERTLQAELKLEKESALKALANEFQAKLLENQAKVTSQVDEKLRKEVERVGNETEKKCNELHDQEIATLLAKHQQLVSEIKKKQWCYNCENEAIYHCCWNTSYCSTECQQLHWKEEHKRTCRRKR